MKPLTDSLSKIAMGLYVVREIPSVNRSLRDHAAHKEACIVLEAVLTTLRGYLAELKGGSN